MIGKNEIFILSINVSRSSMLIFFKTHKLEDYSKQAVTKIGEVQNKVTDVNGLVKKADCNAKISGMRKKYFTTSDYHKVTKDIQK